MDVECLFNTAHIRLGEAESRVSRGGIPAISRGSIARSVFAQLIVGTELFGPLINSLHAYLHIYQVSFQPMTGLKKSGAPASWG
jgi:hypothetical protein